MDLTLLCLRLYFILTLGNRQGAYNSFYRQVDETKALMLKALPKVTEIVWRSSPCPRSWPPAFLRLPPQHVLGWTWMAAARGKLSLGQRWSLLQCLHTQRILLQIKTLKCHSFVLDTFLHHPGREQCVNRSPSTQNPFTVGPTSRPSQPGFIY